MTVSMMRVPRTSHAAWDCRPEGQVPMLRLRGKWLAELGFEAGVKVAVETAPGRLVITPAPTPEAEAHDA
jgi:Toxin SymE, type I toxin-antitoxin system